MSGLLFALGGEHHRTDLLGWWAGGWLQSRTPRRTSRLVALKHNFRLTDSLCLLLSSPVSRPGYCVWSPIRPRGLIPLHVSIRLVGWRSVETDTTTKLTDGAGGTGVQEQPTKVLPNPGRPGKQRKDLPKTGGCGTDAGAPKKGEGKTREGRRTESVRAGFRMENKGS